MREEPTLKNLQQLTVHRTELNEYLNRLGKPYIETFDRMITHGLRESVLNIPPETFVTVCGQKISFWYEDIQIARPCVPSTCVGVNRSEIYPTECRQRAISYTGKCTALLGISVDGITLPSFLKDMGQVPIMLKSKLCNLSGKSPIEMVHEGEHENEWGGYFIIKGHEKLVRMLLMSRRNYPVGVTRRTWRDRGQHFSEFGVTIRAVAHDETATTNVLHFVETGSAKLALSLGKSLTIIPVLLMMKALVDYADDRIYHHIVRGYEDDHFFLSCVQNMLRDVHEEGIQTHSDAKEYLGNVIGSRFDRQWPDLSPTQKTERIIKTSVLIHLNSPIDKFNLLVVMIQKLFQLAQGKIKSEGVDSVMMQEVLQGGQLYQMVMKDTLRTILYDIKMHVLKRSKDGTEIISSSLLTNAFRSSRTLASMNTFLSTGNIKTSNGIGLQQESGLVIGAENINRMRYMSHFRAVHRGSFFVEMRTTDVRKLLPDAWGFICPVHTPDGSPCGLLNHLAVDCELSHCPDEKLVAGMPKELVELGMVPLSSNVGANSMCEMWPVLLEGRVVGHIRSVDASRIADKLRALKIEGIRIPNTTEIVMLPKKEGFMFPGLFLFVGPSRMLRPVMNLSAKNIELIGTFEQVFMDICITAEEAYPGVTTHMELSKTAFMSNLAKLIPMPDCNQSPRNMYQCQMGKQTMGTPCHNWHLQAQNKLYRLQTPATPLFRPVHYDNIELDDFAMGTNAVVAVISYTGYDMEDAMIINKSSQERGFAHGSIQKSEFITLTKETHFERDPFNNKLVKFMDVDGLPRAGTPMGSNSFLYCYFDNEQAKYVPVKYKGDQAFVDNVKLCGGFSSDSPQVACITFRVPRNPSVGDKFASRAGQKGICSQLMPSEDLPFTESGLVPDIVFNPHGFPSRMTIAMMIELMAGKTASAHGLVHDATPFKFTEEDTAIDHFGQLLEQAGYNYYGTEPMYSGIDGREMHADIFFGVVHYQRLRHMVSDKWQVRSTGSVDPITHQPVKGRKRGGGVRFGEMERDALISHGASFLLQDRLFHCSDKSATLICRNCGSLLGPVAEVTRQSACGITKTAAVCLLCRNDSDIGCIEIPYVFRFLVTQLSAVNIKVKINVNNI